MVSVKIVNSIAERARYVRPPMSSVEAPSALMQPAA
jgi:hypothetical protein